MVLIAVLLLLSTALVTMPSGTSQRYLTLADCSGCGYADATESATATPS